MLIMMHLSDSKVEALNLSTVDLLNVPPRDVLITQKHEAQLLIQSKLLCL